MMPKCESYEDCNYVLYNLGGIMLNAIVSIISAILYFTLNSNKYINLILVMIIIICITVIITNGIPLKIGGIANDGYNILAISKDDFIKYCFYIQLKVNGLLSKGIRVKDMPIEWFYLKDGTDLNNPIVTALKIMECGYYVDNLNFEAAQRCYEEILEKSTNIIKVYEYEIKCELLFFEILKGNIDKIEEIYTKELRNYIKATKFHISRKRLMYAYNLLVLKDKEKAEKSLIEFEKVKKSYPIKGEILMEEDVVNFIRNTNSAKMV